MITNPPIPYGQDVELVPADESNDIQHVIHALEVLLARRQAKGGECRPDVHVKTHGYVQGEFRVLPNLPHELGQGLFKSSRSYSATVRFSNASSRSQPDAIPDGRGMAIKVFGLEGFFLPSEEVDDFSQDFVMINHPVFFARNVKDLLRLERVLVDTEYNSFATVQSALTGGDWNPLNWHWNECLTVARIAAQVPSLIQDTTYYSMTPFRFGRYVAKCRARPVGIHRKSYTDLIKRLEAHPDALRLALEEMLRSQELLFEFQVQLRNAEQAMPIEDATIEWPESASPYRTVAYLLLPRQDISSLRQQPEFQNLSFNVWHALTDHRPLGGINRVRRWVYPISYRWRRQQTDNKSSEPKSILESGLFD